APIGYQLLLLIASTPVSPASSIHRSTQCLADLHRIMRVPQDIVDAILDTFALTYDDGIYPVSHEPLDRDTLRACALTSHSFLHRSQLHLFSAITCRSHSHLMKLDQLQLLAMSPHIGPLYVRYFALDMFRIPTVELVAECSVLTARVLPILTTLACLVLDPFVIEAEEYPWGTQPVFLKTAYQTALALSSLRSLDLFRYSFADISSLESFLRHAKSTVKRLSLSWLTFHDTSFGREGHIADDRPTVLLEHLQLTDITKNDTDAMVSGFRAVDIKRLRSMSISHSFMSPNSNPDPIDPDILEDSQSLHSLDIEQVPCHICYALQELGNLSHLKALKVITISFSNDEETSLGDVGGRNWTRYSSKLGTGWRKFVAAFETY
ncbi:hypothetical protein C8J57DRAFT_1639051, partial [Mycena rebaudengoi]